MTTEGDSSAPVLLERAKHDFQGKRGIGTAVVLATARASGTDPTALPALTKTVDPDALETLCAPAGNSRRSAVTVTFRYAGYDIIVQSDGTIHVYGGPAALDRPPDTDRPGEH